MTTLIDTGSSAEFSPCRNYRYTLHRRWSPGCDVDAWIMLNPSTADETLNDPTIRRCISFSKSWGSHALVIPNLFALRSTDPRALDKAADPIGEQNNAMIDLHAWRSRIIVAWGCDKTIGERDREVIKLLGNQEVFCLGVTKDGYPRHPLYVAGNTKPMRYPGREVRE